MVFFAPNEGDHGWKQGPTTINCVAVFLTFTKVWCLMIKGRKCTSKTDYSYNTIKFCFHSPITKPAKPYIWYCCQRLYKYWTIKEYYKDFYLLDYNTVISWKSNGYMASHSRRWNSIVTAMRTSDPTKECFICKVIIWIAFWYNS
jgi:hypothetical protein